MKRIIGLLGLSATILMSGCVVGPPYPASGVSVGVYGEYPATYYGHGHYYYSRYPYRYRYHRYSAPYDRDHYYYRSHTW